MIVEQIYGLDAAPVDALGCRLCHQDDVGGNQNLIAFGKIVQSYGTNGMVPDEASALKSILIAIQAQYPNYIADIQEGRDPNQDTSTPPPIAPEYGCAVGRAGTSSGLASIGGGLTFVAVLAAVRRRTSRR